MRVLTMREFGRMGRFGNQLFQYAFLQIYANEHNCQLQLPPWIGSDLFGLTEPVVTSDLETYRGNSSGLSHGKPPEGDILVNRNFSGYTHYHSSYYAPYCQPIREMFSPVPNVLHRLLPAVDKLRNAKKITVGIHLRRGDYGRRIFAITPTSWYLRWLDKHYEALDRPQVFIATEDPSLVEDFAKYDPQTMETLGIDLAKEPLANFNHLGRDITTDNARAFDFYPDFYLLTQCNVILIPNSTFSFFAAMLAPRLKELWRSCLDAGEFIQVDPWDSYPLLRQHVKNYPHLEGIALPGNPYW